MNPPTPQTPSQELRGIVRAIAEYLDSNEIDRGTFAAGHGLTTSILERCTAKSGKIDDAEAAGVLPIYRAALDSLSAGAEGGGTELYEDLSTARAVRGQTSRLIYSATLARILIIKGETGAGKTSTLDIIRDKYNAMSAQPTVFRVEAAASWGDRPNNMLGEMLQALGVDPGKRNAATRSAKVIDTVNNRGVITVVQIDEVHDFGVQCLRELKHIINRCPIKVQLACHKRLFRTIEAEHSDDLSQLTGNRLLAIVELPAPKAEDILILLKRRLPNLSSADAPKVAAELARHAKGNGNLGFVREVIVRARAKQGPLTAADLDAHLRAELRARSTIFTNA